MATMVVRYAAILVCLTLLGIAAGRPEASGFFFPDEEPMLSEATSTVATATEGDATSTQVSSQRSGESELGKTEEKRNGEDKQSVEHPLEVIISGGRTGDLPVSGTANASLGDDQDLTLEDSDQETRLRTHTSSEDTPGSDKLHESNLSAQNHGPDGEDVDSRAQNQSAVGSRRGRLISIDRPDLLNATTSTDESEAEPEDQDADVARSASSLVFYPSRNADGSLKSVSPSSSSSLFFPGWLQRMTQKSLPSCDGRTVSAINSVTGACQMLGSSSGCPEGQYFFHDPVTDIPVCRQLDCPEDYLLFHGVCRLEDDLSACPEGMSLTRDRYGSGECDCRIGFTLWPGDRRCYPALRQGPCPVGTVLASPTDGHEELCIENVCMRDGSLVWFEPGAIGCYELDEPDNGCESEQLLYLDWDRQKLVCNPLKVRAIFNLPTVRCLGDARRDYGGNCRNPLNQSFRGRR